MKILHLISVGDTGGIQKLCKDIGIHAKNDEHHFVFLYSGGEMFDKMKEQSLAVDLLHCKSKRLFKLYRSITRIIKRENIDCIIIHQSVTVWIAFLLYLKKKKRSRVVVYVHNSYNVITRKKKIIRYIYNQILLKCDGVVAISEFVKRTVLEGARRVTAEKVEVIYNGVATQDYSVERLPKCSLPIKLIYVGRLIKDKGVQVLLEALSKLEDKDKFRLQVIGEGNYRLELETLTKRLKLEDVVTFCGLKSNISQYLADADVFVHPAIWEEGFGITLVEAMSSGLICIAFNRGAISEVIENNVTGFLVDECTSDAMKKKIKEVQKLLKEDNLIDMRKKAEQRATKFSIEEVIQQLHKICQG